MTDYWKFGKCPLNRGGKRKFWEVTFGSGWPKWTLPVEYKLCFNEERHKILTITFIKVTDITETLRTMLNETGRNDRLLIIEIDPLQVYCRNFTWVLTKFVLRSKLTAKLDSFLGGGGASALCETWVPFWINTLGQLTTRISLPKCTTLTSCYWKKTKPFFHSSSYVCLCLFLSLKKVKSIWGFILKKMAATIIFALNLSINEEMDALSRMSH